jgi:hypothetical protein
LSRHGLFLYGYRVKFLCLSVGLLLLPVSAGAQVVINQAALAQLSGIASAAPAAPVMAKPAQHVTHRTAYRTPSHAAKPARPPAPAKPQPVPATAAIPVPPPAKPVAIGAIAIAFAAGSSDLPPGAAGALSPLCHAAGFVTINATAPNAVGDPSAAMRLSLNRAFAIRAALTACGIPSSRIIPRSLGAVPGHAEDTAQVSLAP